MTIDRQTAQMLITKLDLNAISLKEVKKIAKNYGIEIKARTKDQASREIGRAVA